MTDANAIVLDADDRREIARFPRLGLQVDFMRYSWIFKEEVAVLDATYAEHQGKPTYGRAMMAFFEDRSIAVRRPECPSYRFYFSPTDKVVGVAVHHEIAAATTHLYVLDEEAMVGRLSSGRHWQDPQLGQLLALVDRFGLRGLPGLLTFANGRLGGSGLAARVLRTIGAPEVAPTMARALLDRHGRPDVLRWLETHRAVAEASLAPLLTGSLVALAHLSRSGASLDPRLGELLALPPAVALAHEVLDPKAPRAPVIDLGDTLDRTCACTREGVRFHVARTVHSDAEASERERADIKRLFARVGEGFVGDGSIEAFLKANYEDEGISIRIVEDRVKAEFYVAYLHAIGDNIAGYVVRADAERAVVAEIIDTQIAYEPGPDDPPWP